MTRAASRTLLIALALPPLLVAAGGLFVAEVAYPALLVLAVVTAGVCLAPLAWQDRTASLDAFSPLSYAVWFFFIPAFAVGASLVAFGSTPAWLLEHIPSPSRTFPLTQFYLALGIASVSAGYLLPWPQRVGRSLSDRLPAWAWSPGEVVVPALLLLAGGVGLTFYVFNLGVIGFQGGGEVGRLSVAAYFLSLSWMFAAVLLWGVVFRDGVGRWTRLGLIALLVLLIPLHAFLSGSRATPLNHVIALGLAFNYSGRVVRPRHVIIFAVLFVVSLGAGMLYGTTFRLQKTLAAIDAANAPAPTPPPPAATAAPAVGPPAPTTPQGPPPPPRLTPGEARASMAEQQSMAARATSAIAERGLARNAAFVVRQVAARLDHVSSVAAIVGNYERLRDEEDRRGLSGNIWRWTWTAFVPRAVWPGKPLVGDPRAIGELYLGFGASSPAITPFADLLRNFGPLGIPVGMFVLGVAMRLLHASLVSAGPPSLGRTVVYYAVLMRLSFEGFYGTLMPEAIRAAFVAVLMCLVVEGWCRYRRRAVSARAGK